MDYLEPEEERLEEEVEKYTTSLHLLIDKCITNLGEDDLFQIKEKMELLVEQGLFWQKEENTKRYLYDLREFLNWLCDFLEKKDNQFLQ